MAHVDFGCSTTFVGTFIGDGLVGLGGGDLSLVSQLGADTSLGRRFSYCLAPFFSDVSSALNFGARATVTEPGAVTTPLVPSAVDAFFTIRLTSVKIGNSPIDPPKRSPVIVDSGTSLTFLDKALLDPIVEELSKSIKLPRKQSPQKQLDLSYDVAGESPESWANLLP